MDDSKLDKVIKTLEYCTTSEDCRPCEYWQTFDDTGCQCMKDALELLKEQQERIETLESLRRIKQKGRWYCPQCGVPIDWERWWKENGTRNQDT